MSDNMVWAIIIGLLIAAGIYIFFFWIPPEYRQKPDEKDGER